MDFHSFPTPDSIDYDTAASDISSNGTRLLALCPGPCSVVETTPAPVPMSSLLPNPRHSLSFLLNEDLPEPSPLPFQTQPNPRQSISFLLNTNAPDMTIQQQHCSVSGVQHENCASQVDPSLYGPDERGRWMVYRVADRALGPHRGKYKVIWYGSCPNLKKPVTYESRKHLVREGLKQAVLLVDRWIRKGKIGSLRAFARAEKQRGPLFTVSRRSNSGTCGFKALQLACKLQGIENVVTENSIDAFIAEYKVTRGIDLRFGATWKDLNVS